MGNITSLDQLKNNTLVKDYVVLALNKITKISKEYNENIHVNEDNLMNVVQNGTNKISGFNIAGNDSYIKIIQNLSLSTIIKSNMLMSMINNNDNDVEINLITTDLLNLSDKNVDNVIDMSDPSVLLNLCGIKHDKCIYDYDSSSILYIGSKVIDNEVNTDNELIDRLNNDNARDVDAYDTINRGVVDKYELELGDELIDIIKVITLQSNYETILQCNDSITKLYVDYKSKETNVKTLMNNVDNSIKDSVITYENELESVIDNVLEYCDRSCDKRDNDYKCVMYNSVVCLIHGMLDEFKHEISFNLVRFLLKNVIYGNTYVSDINVDDMINLFYGNDTNAMSDYIETLLKLYPNDKSLLQLYIDIIVVMKYVCALNNTYVKFVADVNSELSSNNDIYKYYINKVINNNTHNKLNDIINARSFIILELSPSPSHDYIIQQLNKNNIKYNDENDVNYIRLIDVYDIICNKYMSDIHNKIKNIDERILNISNNFSIISNVMGKNEINANITAKNGGKINVIQSNEITNTINNMKTLSSKLNTIKSHKIKYTTNTNDNHDNTNVTKQSNRYNVYKIICIIIIFMLLMFVCLFIVGVVYINKYDITIINDTI